MPRPPQRGDAGAAAPGQQPEQPGWGRRHPILTGCLGIIALFVVLGIIGAALGGGGGGGQQAQDQGQKQEKPQEQQGQQQPAQQQGGGQQAESSGGEGVIFRVTGAQGVRFQGSITTMDKSRSVQGTTPQDYRLKGVDTGMFSTDIVSGNAQKMGPGTQKLTVQIVVDGKVVKQASTTASYGVAQVSWSPSE